MSFVYYLFLNKIRENIRVIKRMKSAVVAIVIVFAFFIYQFYVNMWPAIAGFGYNANYFKVVIALITVLSVIKYLSGKPNIKMEPITLHILQNTNSFKWYYAFKLFLILIKNALLSIILSILAYGGMFEASVFIIFFTMLCSKDFMKWILYNKNNKLLSIASCVITILLGLSGVYSNRIILYGFSGIFIVSYIYAMTSLKLNPAYHRAMFNLYELHLAEVSGDTRALSKYAEDNNNTMFQSSKQNIKYPIAWKSFISIFRLDIKFFLFAVGFFIACFLMKITNITDGIPMLELDMIKQMLLLMSVFFLLQMIIQLFLREFEKLINNHKSGLFIPFGNSELIRQYLIVPIPTLIITLAIIALFLRSNIILAICVMIVVPLLCWFQLFMVTNNKKLLTKITPIINVIFLASCSLLFL